MKRRILIPFQSPKCWGCVVAINGQATTSILLGEVVLDIEEQSKGGAGAAREEERQKGQENAPCRKPKKIVVRRRNRNTPI